MSSSILAHAAVAVAIVASPSLLETGAIETPSEAISVELAASAVIEQASITPDSQTAAAVPSTTAMNDGEQVEAVEASEATQVKMAVDAPAEVVVSEAVAGEPADAVISGTGPEAEIQPAQPPQPRKDSAQREAQIENRPDKADQQREVVQKPEKSPAREAQAKGGVRARGTASAAQSGGRVSASAGSVAGYAARVRARVASNKPSAAGRVGTAVISFGVTAGGGLAYARLSRSSGVPGLDQAALLAVRRSAPFPVPPAGATSRQLAFSIPFHFR